MLRSLFTVGLGSLAALPGCGGTEEEPLPGDAGTHTGCGAGETAVDGGACQPAGVPPDRCATGFSADDRGGCAAVLPPAPCGPGMTAVPGDSACHEVATCADGTWGDIPVEANTEFVDAAFAGTGSDGTQQSPWKTIGPAVSAAQAGAVIAIAAGSYVGDVSLQDKPVRLWGRCPSQVEIVGDGTRPAAIFIASGANGTEVRGLAIRGPVIGLGLSGSKDVVVDRVWIHDTGEYGMAVRQVIGDSSATLSSSLVEGAAASGIVVSGSALTVEAVEVRGTRPDPVGEGGSGLFASLDPEGAGRPSVTVRGSVFSGNLSEGIALDGADATIDGTLIADTQPQASDQEFGHGILLQPDFVTLEPSKVALTGTVIERCRDVGVLVIGSEITVDATVVRDMLSVAADMGRGRGYHVQSIHDDLTRRGLLVLRDSLVDHVIDLGIMITNSDATVERTVVRATQPRASDGAFGDGLSVVPAGASASVTIEASRFEGQPRAGVASFGANVTIGGTRFECNAIHLDGELYLDSEFHFEDTGGNACGCAGAAVDCTVLSSSLAAPDAL